MGTIGDCFDNAAMESFWGSMQIELLNRKNRKKWMTYVELSTALADYIFNFYDPSRRHSSLDYLTPDDFETLPSSDNPARTLVTVGQKMGLRQSGPINGAHAKPTSSASAGNSTLRFHVRP